MKKVLVAICFLSSLTILGQGKGNCAEYSNKKAEKKFKKMRDYDYPMDRSGTIRKMKELVDKYSGYPELIAFIAGHYHKSSYKKNESGLENKCKGQRKRMVHKAF